jgi:enoyl-CoA hydratase/carnithine racemase
MKNDFLIFEQDGPVVTLTMNKPDIRNALSEPSYFDEFVEACDAINRDMSVRAVILTGAGTAFCAGGNVKQMRDKTGIAQGSPFEIRQGYRHGIQRIPLALYDIEVPTIAAVNGPAIGAGCDLACMCDIRIAGESAKIAESFVKLGIIPGDGGAWLLPRAVGMSKAAELTFTGDMIGAEEAKEIGLVSKVVPDDQLMDEARKLAGRIAGNPPAALRGAKKLLREGQHVRLDTLLEMSAAMQALAHYTKDHEEAINAFLDKRKPSFTGE